MLAGQSEQLKTCVYKSQNVHNLWGDKPVVFRLILLPIILYELFNQFQAKQQFTLLKLGNTGEEFELMNEHLAITPDDPSEMKLAAFAAENVFQFHVRDHAIKHAVATYLTLLQIVIWCIQGENIVMVELGNQGGEIPEWAWEHVQQGPKITNVRLKSFDEPGSERDGVGSPPA